MNLDEIKKTLPLIAIQLPGHGYFSSYFTNLSFDLTKRQLAHRIVSGYGGDGETSRVSYWLLYSKHELAIVHAGMYFAHDSDAESQLEWFAHYPKFIHEAEAGPSALPLGGSAWCWCGQHRAPKASKAADEKFFEAAAGRQIKC